MRALFVTSSTDDVDSLVRAWDCWQEDKAVRVMFQHREEPEDRKILSVARSTSPEIIFYIGACHATGIPSVSTLLALRQMAPLINLCCDAGDGPWHEYLKLYKEKKCFNLQVSLDGCKGAPVDLVTVTPVDPSSYERAIPRTVRCGFSGGVPAWRAGTKIRVNPLRSLIILDLESSEGIISIRRRAPGRPYSEHAEFLMSCQVIINTSSSGSGKIHQIKGRVLEVGWAGGALLESEGSPIADWMPEGSYFLYRDAKHARHLIQTLVDDQIAESAAMLNAHVKSHYHPRQIYGEILERVRS